MRERRQKSKGHKWVGTLLAAILAPPAAYCAAALIGSVIPANHGWVEPRQGTTIYIADNGIHADLIMPVRANGLDWSRQFRARDFAGGASTDDWIAFGSGERAIYLDTPSWSDVRLRTLWHAIVGGPRVIHVEYVDSPLYAARQLRVRPAEYRRLWAAVRADFALDASGHPQPVARGTFGNSDAFYAATGNANYLRTCNSVLAQWFRLAGIKASVWPPFVNGLVWRYRKLRG